MPSFNKVILMGNLTRDPEVRTVGANAVKVCRFALALNERRRDRNGNMVGEPILGGINSEKQMKALQTMIDEVLARDAAMLDKDMLMKPDGN